MCVGDSGPNKTPSGTGDHRPHHHDQRSDGPDDFDEDDMEGTDLLHLISNSLDRFNAIVHPHDLSGLTSGLGASEGLLSDLDWSLSETGNPLNTLRCGKTGTSLENEDQQQQQHQVHLLGLAFTNRSSISTSGTKKSSSRVHDLDGTLDTAMLLSRDSFTSIQRPETLVSTSSVGQQQQTNQSVPSSLAVNHGSKSGKSVLSTCMASDYSWDVKGLDAWNGLYPACDRRTRPATTGPSSSRSRLPHSDSVAFGASEHRLDTRRASLSTGLPFDVHDLVPPGLNSMRFDSPDPMVAAAVAAAAHAAAATASVYGNASTVPLGMSNVPGVMDSSRRPILAPAGVTSSAYSLLQPPETTQTTTGTSMRFVTNGANGNTLSAPQQARHGTWSTNWPSKSPTLRATNNTEVSTLQLFAYSVLNVNVSPITCIIVLSRNVKLSQLFEYNRYFDRYNIKNSLVNELGAAFADIDSNLECT
ncbi:unnamed protein product [Echinostoma caproni]|uniref:BHLH domain-containing protein n=1 Tax=Echinostoma caproni TaxID=27848 RepID=A0A183AQF3_9TREM|nr:unnamed protein product [Echinostoma caproni]